MEDEKVLAIVVDMANKANEINKRCITAIIATVISFCVLLGAIAITYFTADYGYANSISNVNSDDNENEIGGVEGD